MIQRSLCAPRPQGGAEAQVWPAPAPHPKGGFPLGAGAAKPGMTFSFKNGARRGPALSRLALSLPVRGARPCEGVLLPPEPAPRSSRLLSERERCARAVCAGTGAAPRTLAAGGEGRPVGPHALAPSGLRGPSLEPPNALCPPRGPPLTAVPGGRGGRGPAESPASEPSSRRRLTCHL